MWKITSFILFCAFLAWNLGVGYGFGLEKDLRSMSFTDTEIKQIMAITNNFKLARLIKEKSVLLVSLSIILKRFL